MSGIKDSYVRLNDTEHDRLLKNMERVDDVENHLSRRLQHAAQHFRDALDRHIMRIPLSEFEDEVDTSAETLNLEQPMPQFEHQQNIRLLKTAQHFQERLTEQLHLKRDQPLINTLQQHTTQLQNTLAKQQQTLIAEMPQQLHHLQDLPEQAEQWLENTNALLDAINTQFRHATFTPHMLGQLRQELLLSQSNFQQQNYQAAIASCQQTYLRSQQLRLQLEYHELTWHAYLNAARFAVSEAVAACECNQSPLLSFEETEDDVQSITVDVDYWTEGQLSAIQSDTSQLEWDLKYNAEQYDVATLQQFIQRAENWTQQSYQLVELAKEALIASQLRNNIGQTIEDALSDAGWEIIDATYEGEDFRAAVHVKLQNLAGDEIVTIIHPESGSGEDLNNRLRIAFFDRTTNDQGFRQERLRRITQLLRSEGLQCTEPQCVPGTENKSSEAVDLLDFDEIRERNLVGVGVARGN